MRCLNNYKDDRICDMCKLSTQCKRETAIQTLNSRIKYSTVQQIKNNCQYRKRTYSDFEQYFGCTLNWEGKDYKECEPIIVNKKCIKAEKGKN